MKIGDWEIIQFNDYENDEWSYEHIYKHADGRVAIVGPGGYCSDPDLSWLLHRSERKIKQMARIKIAISICLNAVWLPVVIQGIQQCHDSGWIALASIIGYGICSLGSFGSLHALIFPDYKNSWKGRAKILMICVSMFVAGSGLVTVGGFTAITLGGTRVNLVLASAVLSLAGSLTYRWRQNEIN